MYIHVYYKVMFPSFRRLQILKTWIQSNLLPRPPVYILRPPAHKDHILHIPRVSFHVTEPAYKDHLCVRTTFYWSTGWWLYIQVSLYFLSALTYHVHNGEHIVLDVTISVIFHHPRIHDNESFNISFHTVRPFPSTVCLSVCPARYIGVNDVRVVFLLLVAILFP